MSSARKPTSWLSVNYDKVAVVVVLVALLISAAMLMLQLQSASRGISPQDLVATQPIGVTALDMAPLDALAERIAQPYQIASAQRRMLVGDLRVSSIPDGLPIPFDAAVCPFTGAKQPAIISPEERDSDGDGIPDVWEIKYGLNPFDPSDAQLDMDGDGFTNLEEYLAGTDPTNPEDFPPPSAKLRLLQSRLNPFKLLFQGTQRLPNGEQAYQLNLRSGDRTHFIRMNEDVEGFTVVGYEEKAPEGPTLILRQGDKTMRIVQGRVRDEQAFTALMVFLVDGKRFRVNIGESVNLLDQNYKVVDIRQNAVVIRDEVSGRDIEIGPISDEERRALSAGN